MVTGTWHEDDKLFTEKDRRMLRLLTIARAQGVRTLEVRADGSFSATLDPPEPAPEPPPKDLTPEERAKADEALLLHSARG